MGRLKRYVATMASAGWLLAGLPTSLGCAGGGSDDGINGVPVTDSAPPDGASEDVSLDREGEASADTTTADATNDTVDGASDAQDASESAAGDASGASDANTDASVRLDASSPDAEPSDGSTDASPEGASPDGADAALPSCPATGTCGVQALCISGFCTPSRRVFVSTQMFTGNLGGTSGADATCQSIANAAQLGGSWKAWVSDSTTSPSTRFTHASVGYRLLDGTLLANDWSGLVSGALDHAIDLTEQRGAAAGSEVWTGTLESGVAIGTNVCGGFTSSANAATHAVIGNTSRTDIGWSNATSQSCDQNNLRIYCMEQ
jgi:hypothetical protein